MSWFTSWFGESAPKKVKLVTKDDKVKKVIGTLENLIKYEKNRLAKSKDDEWVPETDDAENLDKLMAALDARMKVYVDSLAYDTVPSNFTRVFVKLDMGQIDQFGYRYGNYMGNLKRISELLEELSKDKRVADDLKPHILGAKKEADEVYKNGSSLLRAFNSDFESVYKSADNKPIIPKRFGNLYEDYRPFYEAHHWYKRYIDNDKAEAKNCYEKMLKAGEKFVKSYKAFKEMLEKDYKIITKKSLPKLKAQCTEMIEVYESIAGKRKCFKELLALDSKTQFLDLVKELKERIKDFCDYSMGVGAEMYDYNSKVDAWYQ